MLRSEQVNLSQGATRLVDQAHKIYDMACERFDQFPTPELKEILTKATNAFASAEPRLAPLKALEAAVISHRDSKIFDDLLPQARLEIQDRRQAAKLRKLQLEADMSRCEAKLQSGSGKPAENDGHGEGITDPTPDAGTESLEANLQHIHYQINVQNEAISHFDTMQAVLSSGYSPYGSHEKDEQQQEEDYKEEKRQKISKNQEKSLQKQKAQQQLQHLWKTGQDVIKSLRVTRKNDSSSGKSDSSPFGNTNSSPFGKSSSSTFGNTNCSPFGQNISSPFQNTSTPFEQNTYSPFGKPDASSFGQNTSSTFGQNTSSAFGKTDASLFGKPGALPFGQNTFSPFGKTNASPFGKSDASPFGQNTSSTFRKTDSSNFGTDNSFSFGTSDLFPSFRWRIESMQHMITSRSAEESLGLTTQWNNAFYRPEIWKFPSCTLSTAIAEKKWDDLDLLVQHHFRSILRRMLLNRNVLQVFIEWIGESYGELFDVLKTKRLLEHQLSSEEKWLGWQDQHRSARDQDTRANTYDLSKDLGLSDYQYQGLNGRDFRVLILLPAPEPFYPLLCRLETWSMGFTRNPYTALSYCWGAENYSGQLFVLPSYYEEFDHSSKRLWGPAIQHANPVPIRDNLFRALFRFRASGPDAKPVALWVDSLCINQNNAREKTQQLARMVDIYSKASNVSVWLGESDDEGRSLEAMEFIPTIMDFAWLDRHSRDKNMAKKWYALGELMRDPWFSRRWVVQEIALAREATIHCGGSVVAWSDFADAASLLVSGKDTIKLLFDSDWREGQDTLGEVNSFGAAVLLDSTHNLFLRSATGDIKRPIKNLESLVTSLTTFVTGDPRDLVYSLVSIAQDTSYHVWFHSNPGSETPQLKVDYDQSVIEVYRNFTEFCILSSKSLNIICRPWAMPPGGGENLPSWVPLLTSSEYGIPREGYRGRKNGEGLIGLEGSAKYDASAGLKSQAHFKSQDLAAENTTNCDTLSSNTKEVILVASGFILARIIDVSARRSGGVILREALEMGGWTGLKPGTTSVPDAIWRTLVADRDDSGKMPPSWYKRACLRCLEIADRFNDGDLNIGEALHGPSEMLRKYLTRVRNITRNRRFFTANRQDLYPGESKGELDGYFGLCPPETKAGDFICILYGCSVPVVVREEKDGHVRLIGESYVHGMMDGEAVVEFREKTWKGKEFCIR